MNAHAIITNAAVRVGPSTEIKQADDPCRAIEIVALTGQLYATNKETPYRDRPRYSKSAYAVSDRRKICTLL